MARGEDVRNFQDYGRIHFVNARLQQEVYCLRIYDIPLSTIQKLDQKMETKVDLCKLHSIHTV